MERGHEDCERSWPAPHRYNPPMSASSNIGPIELLIIILLFGIVIPIIAASL